MGLYFNTDSLTPSKGSGGGVNNQDITITENGEYSAGEGYTGIGTATVNVPSSGDIITAKNATGTVISEGDKVWLEKRAGSGTRNFDTDGSVSVNDTSQIVSLYGSYYDSCYIYKKYPTSFSQPQNYLEIQIKAKFIHGSGSNGAGARFGATGWSASTYKFGINVGNLGVIISASIGTNPSKTLISSSNVQEDTWYWVKVRITSASGGTASWSFDGQTWYTTDISTSIWSTLYSDPTFYLGRGMYDQYTYYDLSECYIKCDDEYWWQPYLDSEVGWNILPYSFSSQNSFTAITNEEIGVAERGEIKTVLPDTITVSVTADVDNAEISVE